MQTKSNAKIGNEIERSFIRLLRKNCAAIDRIRNLFNIRETLTEAHPTGTNQKKSDVLLIFGNRSLGANIKAGKSNFNQVTRMWLDKLAEEIGLSQDCKNAIQNGIDNHRLKRSRIFIESKFQTVVSKELSTKLKLIAELIFCGLNNNIVKVLALYDRNKKHFYLYDIQSVIDSIAKSEITFSRNGIIKIGNFLTLQKKGGNGVSHKMPKTDSKHPGNQIQFKMKILSFMSSHTPFIILK